MRAMCLGNCGCPVSAQHLLLRIHLTVRAHTKFILYEQNYFALR